MKKTIMLAFMVLCLCIPLTASATTDIKYLNGDQNFPLTGGHANFWEYTDINSCTIAEETDEYYELAVGYVRRSKAEGTPYRVRYFRYYKDGVTRPEYYVEKTDKWVTIPLQTKEIVNAFMQENRGAMAPYRNHFHPDQFHMLRVACRQLFGIELKG